MRREEVEGKGAQPLIDDNGAKPSVRCVTRKQRRVRCAEQLTTFVLRRPAAEARLGEWRAMGRWRWRWRWQRREGGGRRGECEGWAMIAWRGDSCRYN